MVKVKQKSIGELDERRLLKKDLRNENESPVKKKRRRRKVFHTTYLRAVAAADLLQQRMTDRLYSD